MGNTKDPPDPDGTLASMKETFGQLLTMNSTTSSEGLKVFGSKVIKQWKELSKKLQPDSKLEDRSTALAFVVKQCYSLLDAKGFVEHTGLNAEHHTLVQNILGVLHVCMDDHTNYKLMLRNCFEFYGDCLAAMDVFTARAWCLRLTMGSDAEAHVSLASHLQFEIDQAIYYMSRCWSVLRSGTLTRSPATNQELLPTAIEAEMQLQISCLEKAKAQDAAMALVEVDTTVKRFYKLALCFICILSWDMLEGMGTTSELWVDEMAFVAKFKECRELLGDNKKASEKKFNDFVKKLGGATDDAQRAERSWKSLGEILDLVGERRYEAIRELQNAKLGKQILSKKQVNGMLNKKLGGGSWSSRVKSIAAEVLSGGHQELFPAMWGNDTDCGNFERDHFADSASCLLFNAAPFTYAMPTLLRYWQEGLRPDDAGMAKVEDRTFVEDMYIEIKSRKDKIKATDKEIQDKLLQDFAEDEKKAEGKGTRRQTTGPLSSSPARPGQKHTSTPGSTSKSPSEPLVHKGKMDTAEGTLTSPGSKPVGGQEVADPAHVNKLEDEGGREEAHLTQGISSVAIGSVTPQALAGDPTREELEQAEEEFVNSCGRPSQEMKVLLQNVAEVEEHARNLRALSEAVQLLGLSTLRELGLHYSIGRRHPDPKLGRFNTELPKLVEFLAETGLKGSFVSFVEDMSIHFGTARAVAAVVTNAGEDATTTELKELGFAILMFTIAASRLSKALLQNTP